MKKIILLILSIIAVVFISSFVFLKLKLPKIKPEEVDGFLAMGKNSEELSKIIEELNKLFNELEKEISGNPIIGTVLATVSECSVQNCSACMKQERCNRMKDILKKLREAKSKAEYVKQKAEEKIPYVDPIIKNELEVLIDLIINFSAKIDQTSSFIASLNPDLITQEEIEIGRSYISELKLISAQIKNEIEIIIYIFKEKKVIYSESFEEGFGGWVADHHLHCEHEEPLCVPGWPLEWSITRSEKQAYDGIYSLDCYLNGDHDDGTIWVERVFNVNPNSNIDVEISFYLWSSEYSELNQWPVVAFVGLRDPEIEEDFEIIGRTNDVAGWKKYFYSKQLKTDSSGILWIAFGFGATWEIERTYYMDLVGMEINLK